MSASSRIGVFGGTFDPVHITHLDIARAALESANLDTILFVVAARPPHKRDGTVASPEERLAMVTAAVADQPRMEPEGLELGREGPSYMVDTLREIHRRDADAELFLIIGMDSLIDLPQWKEPEEIVRLARLLAVPRPGKNHTVPSVLANAYDRLPFAETEVSSTEIRDGIRQGADVSKLVPPATLDYIEARGIYHVNAEHGTGA